jgi:hypothetical protein
MRKATEIDPSPKLSNYWQTGSNPRLLLTGQCTIGKPRPLAMQL